MTANPTNSGIVARRSHGRGGLAPTHAMTTAPFSAGLCTLDGCLVPWFTHWVPGLIRVRRRVSVSMPRGHEFWFQFGHSMWPGILFA